MESNSTISELAFNTENWKLSFTAAGPEDTRGYIRVTVAKSLVADIANIRVYMDGRQTEFSITSPDDSWLLTFSYAHSTHQVVVDLGFAEVDTTSPAIVILDPENRAYSVNDVPLAFTVDEATSWIGYSLDGQANVTIAGDTTLSDLSDGLHTLTVYANDTAGNTGSSTTFYFSVDTVLPTIEILSPENVTYTENSVSLTLVYDETISWDAYSLDGHANVTIAGDTTLTGLADGAHNLRVYARDLAGNTGASETIHFSITTPQPFPIEAIAAIGTIALIGAAVLVYFTKFRKQ